MVDTVASREAEAVRGGGDPERACVCVHILSFVGSRYRALPHGRSPRLLDSLFCQNRFPIDPSPRAGFQEPPRSRREFGSPGWMHLSRCMFRRIRLFFFASRLVDIDPEFKPREISMFWNTLYFYIIFSLSFSSLIYRVIRVQFI